MTVIIVCYIVEDIIIFHQLCRQYAVIFTFDLYIRFNTATVIHHSAQVCLKGLL
ncbi:hypothetical protein D3C87_1700770 [compost metagenome]